MIDTLTSNTLNPQENQTTILDKTNTKEPLFKTRNVQARYGGHSSFYDATSFYVECDAPRSVLSDYEIPQNIPGITPSHWPHWAEWPRERAMDQIYIYQSRCEACRCGEGGILEPLPSTHPDNEDCPNDDFVMDCIVVYGCSCHTDLFSASPDPERESSPLMMFSPESETEPPLLPLPVAAPIPVQEEARMVLFAEEHHLPDMEGTQALITQAAINRWLIAHGHRPNPTEFDRPPEPEEWELADDESDPYFLEGPGRHPDIHDRRNLFSGGLYRGSGSGSGIDISRNFKRDNKVRSGGSLATEGGNSRKNTFPGEDEGSSTRGRRWNLMNSI
ncbi:hypothetical protein TWF730_000854 [Orbilia blumenaviensis]|uniref:Uncharacterized protein n=1 Tax=Orbilia blumenaviensis TaxID=1796055 RepID=A0AAV9VQ31_9PEZI